MPSVRTIAAAALVLALSGCELIGTIFEAGVWAGVIGVVLVVGLIVYLISKMKR